MRSPPQHLNQPRYPEYTGLAAADFACGPNGTKYFADTPDPNGNQIGNVGDFYLARGTGTAWVKQGADGTNLNWVQVSLGGALATAWTTVLDIDLTAESSVDIRAGGDGNYLLDSGETISVENSAATSAYDITNGTGVVITGQFDGTIFNAVRTSALFSVGFPQWNFVPHVPTKFQVQYELVNATSQFEGMVLVVEHSNIGVQVNNLYYFDASDGAGDRTQTWGRTNNGTSTSTTNTVQANADLGINPPRGMMLTTEATYADWRPSLTGQVALPPLVSSSNWESFGVSAVAAAINRSFDNATGAMTIGMRSIATSPMTLIVSRVRVDALV